jgi:hypothetical protein
MATFMIYDKTSEQRIKQFGQVLVPIDLATATFEDLYSRLAFKLASIKEACPLKYDDTTLQLWMCQFQRMAVPSKNGRPQMIPNWQSCNLTYQIQNFEMLISQCKDIVLFHGDQRETNKSYNTGPNWFNWMTFAAVLEFEHSAKQQTPAGVSERGEQKAVSVAGSEQTILD